MRDIKHLNWEAAHLIKGYTFYCGYCGTQTSPSHCFYSSQDSGLDNQKGYLFICTNCNKPSFSVVNFQTKDILEINPSRMMGREIEGLPNDVKSLYDEARKATSVNSHTAAVLSCRKILMHIAVDKGADKGLSFTKYVEYLDDKNLIPIGAKKWVDYIRKKSNIANHEIMIMLQQDAENLIYFTSALLLMVYELEAKSPNKPPPEPNNET